jgi:hypothetical protein
VSVPETHSEEIGQRSRVKIIVNTRGVQWEISVVVGESEEAVDEARGIAIRMHRALEEEFGLRPAEAA